VLEANRDLIIKVIVDKTREDLRSETYKALKLFSKEEINELTLQSDVVLHLEIESILCKMVLENRLKESDVPGWKLSEGIMWDAVREKELPGIRNEKIDGLTGD